MEKMNRILFITEDPETDRWYLDWKKPQFQGGESVEISKEDAIKLMKLLTYDKTLYIGDEVYDPNTIR